jgi:two-component system NarL family sensor kinase
MDLTGEREREAQAADLARREESMTALSPEATESSRMRLKRVHRAIAIPRYLMLLAAVCMGCGLVLTASLLLDRAGKERRAIEAQAITTSRAVATSIDREIAVEESRLEALVSSPALIRGDIGAFYDQLAATRVPEGTWLVLDDTRQQLLSTLRPLGAALPKVDDNDPSERESLAKAMRGDRLYVGNQRRGAVSQLDAVAVSLPVRRGNEVAYVLTASMSSRRLQDVIDEQHLPLGWSGFILNRNGRTVARSPKTDAPSLESALAAMLQEHEADGVRLSPDDGTKSPDLVAFSRSTRSGWTAATAVPLALAEVPLRRALLQIAGGGSLLLAIGGAAAWTLARRNERPAPARREAQERQQSMMDALSAQIAVLDEHGTIIAVNAAWRRFAEAGGFGGRPCGIGASYLRICGIAPAAGDGEPADGGSNADRTGSAAVMRREGDVLYLGSPAPHGPVSQGIGRWFRIHVARFAADVDRRLLVMHEDITDARRTEDALRQLTGQIMRLQDEERRRIARDLHDSTAQNLLGAALGIDRSLRLTQFIPYRAERALRESKDLIEQSQREIRTVSYLLHPPLLDEAGLPSALRWYIEGFAKRSGIAVDFDVAPTLIDRRMPADLETALFRIVQEALANVCRHSGSTTARIELARSETVAPNAMILDEVQLTIVDAGRGMTGGGMKSESEGPDLAFAGSKPGMSRVDPAGARNGGRAGIGVGLPGMRERLRQFGGRLDIESGASGTTVRATVPVGVARRAAG